MSSNDAKECPWCHRMALKDDACNYIFACGLGEHGFQPELGCGRPWCWECGKKFCGKTIAGPHPGVFQHQRTSHDEVCCRSEPGFKQEDYCPGGHNSHCSPRW